jgi:hypothetical protein
MTALTRLTEAEYDNQSRQRDHCKGDPHTCLILLLIQGKYTSPDLRIGESAEITEPQVFAQ